MLALFQTDNEGFVLWLGVLCSSWSIASRGSTLRSHLGPLGDLTRRAVHEGNVMISRTGFYLLDLVYGI